MALGTLPVFTVTEYGAYRFPAGETVETVGYVVKPLYDGSRRTVVGGEFTITLQWYIANASTTDVEVNQMVAELTKPAQVLKYRGRGTGTKWETINQGEVRDIDNGPRPGPVELAVVGAGRAVRARWTVTFVVPTCDDRVFRGIREFFFTVSYGQDYAGYTTRTYTATLRIAQTRRTPADRVPIETADDYYEQMVPALVPRFRRESQQRTLSADRCSLDVTVVDVEMPPAILPSGLVTASVRHTYTSKPGTLGYQWYGTIEGDYEVSQRDGTVLSAVKDFLALCKDRVDRARQMVVEVNPIALGRDPGVGPAAGRPVGKAILPWQYSVAEGNVYGRQTAKFMMSYFVAGVKLSEILRSGGLWQPWNGGMKSWADWLASVPNVYSPRGNAELRFSPRDDKIIDLCAPGLRVETVREIPAGSITPGFIQQAAEAVRAGADPVVKGELVRVFPPPAAVDSWLDYKCFVAVRPATGRVVGHTLPVSPLSTDRVGSPTWDILRSPLPTVDQAGTVFPPLGTTAFKGGGPSVSTSVGAGGSGAQPGLNPNGQVFVQQRTTGELYVTFSGTALRVGFDIPCPEVTFINGKKPILVGQPVFQKGIVGNALYPVVRAEWSLTYVVPDVPTGVPTPPNSVLA